jgi:hypothetical protein
MLTLVWRDTAIRQLEEIVAYISKENLDAALRLRRPLSLTPPSSRRRASSSRLSSLRGTT